MRLQLRCMTVITHFDQTIFEYRLNNAVYLRCILLNVIYSEWLMNLMYIIVSKIVYLYKIQILKRNLLFHL